MKLEDLFEGEILHTKKDGSISICSLFFEMFDDMPEIIGRKNIGSETYIYYNIDGNKYVVIVQLDTHPPTNIKFANFVFGYINEKNVVEFKLQNWRSSPIKVLGGALRIVEEEAETLDVDAIIIIGASNKHGDVDKRMRVYIRMARWLARMPKFGLHKEVLTTKKGKISIVWTPNLTPEQHQVFEEYLISRGK